MLNKLTFALALASVTVGVNAEVGTSVLSDMSGSVMVNVGSSYEPARVGMELKPEYRLMAMAGGTATIDYAGQCAVTLEENQIIRVGDSATCLNYQAGAGGGAAGGTTGAGAAAGAGSAGAAASAATTGTIFGVSATTAVLVGGAVVAGAVVVNNNNDDDNNNDISR